MGSAAVPVVVSEVAEEGILQLLLSVLIERILRVFAVDEHGIVTLVHAQQDDNAVPVLAHAQLIGVIELIGGFVNIVPAAVLRKVIHKSNIDTAAVAPGNVRSPCFQFRPLLEGKLVAEIEDIVHIGAGLLRRLRLGIIAGDVRRGVCLEVVLHALRHGVYRLRERRGAHGHVLAIPCALDHVGRHRVAYNVGQFLCAASHRIKKGIHAPIRLRERVSAVLRAAQQQRQRNAVPFLAAAVAGILIDIYRDIRDTAVLHALVGKYIHPQVNAECFRKLRERLLSLIGQFHGAELLGFIVDCAVLHRRHGGDAQSQCQQKRGQQSCHSFFHVRPPLLQHQQRGSDGADD